MSEQKEPAATHQEVQIDRPLRTDDHNVFFPGTAQVNKRALAGIERAQAEEVNRTRSMVDDEGTEDESGKLLGDTRTSAGKKGSKKGKGK